MRCCAEHSRLTRATAGDGLPEIEPGMPAPAGTGLTRRQVMLRGMGLGMAVYAGGSLLASPEAVEAAVADAAGRHRVLVSVYVGGGWDAMSVLAPLGDPDYGALRTRLAVNPAAPVFEADHRLRWHPQAAGLQALWDDPDVGVAVAPAIGYPSANYSHFTSKHFWEVGALDVGGTTGWLGRYLDRVGSPNVPVQGLAYGSSLAPVLATARNPVGAVTSVDDVSAEVDVWGAWGPLLTSARASMRRLTATEGEDPTRLHARMAGHASLDLRADISRVGATPAAGAAAGYPTESRLASGLQTVARVLATDLGGGASLPVRAVAMNADGSFDTHADQLDSFPANLQRVGDSLRAFFTDLKARGQEDRVTVMLWSEFGRRPKENDSGGCDHGAAGTAFVMGTHVRQGTIGEFPGLRPYAAGGTASGLMADGNLRATSDFRAVQAALVEQWLGTEADGIVPDARGLVRPQLF